MRRILFLFLSFFVFPLALLPSLALALDIPADANRNFNPAYLSTSVACGSVQCAVHFQRAAGDPDKGDISVIVDVKDSVPSKDPYYNEKKFHGSATVKAGKDATVMATGLVPSHQYALKLYSTGHSMTNMFKDSYVTISTTSEAMPLSYSVAQPDFSGATKNAKDPYASGKISVSSPAGYAAFNDPSAGFRVSLEYMPGSDASFPPMRTLTSSAYLTNGRDGKSGINPDGTYFFELQPPLAAGADYSVRQTVVPPAGAEPSGPQVSVYHFNTESGFAAPGSDAEKQKYNIRMYRLLVPLPGLSYVMNPDLCAEERSKGRALPVCSADEFVAYALKFLVGVTAVMLVLRLMLDGYNMVTSDVPFLRASAKGSFNESLGGLMLVLCSYLILNTVNPDLVNPGINVGAVTASAVTETLEGNAEMTIDGKKVQVTNVSIGYDKDYSSGTACAGTGGTEAKPNPATCMAFPSSVKLQTQSTGKYSEKNFATRISTLNDRLAAKNIAITINEGWPTTRGHKSNCHSIGLCIDMGVVSPTFDKIKNTITEAASLGMCARYEILISKTKYTDQQNADNQAMYNSIISAGFPKNTLLFKEWISGNHFHLYNGSCK